MEILAPLNCEIRPALQTIETVSSFAIPSFSLVGLPEREVGESKERVRAAISESGFEFPKRKVLVNLSPASIRKSGTGSDLAIALSILLNDQKIELEYSFSAWAELGLTGRLRSCGQITRAIFACSKRNIRLLVLPKEDEKEAFHAWKLVQNVEGNAPLLIFAENLYEAWEFFSQHRSIEQLKELNDRLEQSNQGEPDKPPLKQTVPQLLSLTPYLERTLSAAIAGGHHFVLLGPRGVGKSRALEWLPFVYREIHSSQILEARLVSEIGYRGDHLDSAPIRRVSPNVRPAALIGSVRGSNVIPGEFSFSHGGILIADEFLEWPRDSIECLREPLESGVVTLTRVRGSCELPAKFMFVANGNLCPCGGIPDGFETTPPLPPQRCDCNERKRRDYFKRLSGPIADRIDIVAIHTNTELKGGQTSATELKKKIRRSQRDLVQRFGRLPGQLEPVALERICEDRPGWKNNSVIEKASSLRSRHKMIRLALTLSALDGAEEPTSSHFLEAYSYRAERLFS